MTTTALDVSDQLTGSDDGVPLFGFFREYAAMEPPGLRVTDPFSGPVGAFYARIAAQSSADCHWYVGQAGPAPGTVLDLCCGGGRVAVRFARAGWRVDGVDISPDMITLARRLVDSHVPGAAGSTGFTVADAFDLDTDARYDCVVLGGLTLTLFEDADRRSALLSTAARALKPGGKLLLDYSPVAEDEGADDLTRMFTFALPGPRTGFAIVGNRRQPGIARQSTNVMVERDALNDGRPERFLAGFNYKIIDSAELRAQAMRHGLVYVQHADSVGVPRGVDAPPYRLEAFVRSQ